MIDSTDTLREQLAALAHEMWAGWMRYLFSKTIETGDRCEEIQAPQVERWQRQLSAAYADLPDSEKASDREQADKMLALMYAAPSVIERDLQKRLTEAMEVHKNLEGHLHDAMTVLAEVAGNERVPLEIAARARHLLTAGNKLADAPKSAAASTDALVAARRLRDETRAALEARVNRATAHGELIMRYGDLPEYEPYHDAEIAYGKACDAYVDTLIEVNANA